MNAQPQFEPGPATGAEIHKEAEVWTLVLTRELRHSPAKVWTALTDPGQLREWAPFDADRSLGAVGPAQLTTVGAPTPMVSETRVTRAEAPKLLEYAWGGANVRWELEAIGSGGTRLKLWHNINRGFISMGAAGWHICFEVLDRLLEGRPIGRTVGPKAMQVGGWPRLLAEYSDMLGVEPPKWPAQAKP
jgi:uncharacterized protein YndB with AHSA1/START domain